MSDRPPGGRRPAAASRNMRVSTCLILALATGLAGLSLRAVLPVAAVDSSFREVIRLYRPHGGPGNSNMPETSAP